MTKIDGRRKRKGKVEKTKRVCLKCGCKFLSFHLHNRICLECKKSKIYDSPTVDDYKVHL
jgi:ribosomal protein S27AE